jgi:hypothetical protein
MVFTRTSLARRCLNPELHRSIRYHPTHAIQIITISTMPMTLLYSLVLLSVHGLDVFRCEDGVIVNGTFLLADVRLGVRIELLRLGGEVEVDRIRPGECKEDEGNAHGVPGADLVGNVSENDWDDCTTTDGGNEEGSTALGMATETTHWDDVSNSQNTK